jgi:hypothetical protein
LVKIQKNNFVCLFYVLQWTVLPHKNVEIVGWVSLDEEKRSGKAAAMKLLGRESDKRCSLTGPKGMAKVSASMLYYIFLFVANIAPFTFRPAYDQTPVCAN